MFNMDQAERSLSFSLYVMDADDVCCFSFQFRPLGGKF